MSNTGNAHRNAAISQSWKQEVLNAQSE